ncbi:hypothetical protein BGZ65_001958 [Modicella reniformis]|uniref:MICOS complex subunit n=1 Tax=Modicella reniformis TaxID=1440133 RepID=A0A9P6J154_9FUNG|nr:hypothetical protein BGZ65_001958 [Modicella reniformis]
MFRAAQSLKSKSVVAVGVGMGLLASTRGAIVFAEGKERKQKLPIYDEPEPEMVVKEEPTRLNEAFRVARQETDRQILGMKQHFQVVTNKVVDLEKEAENNIKSVLVKEEDVMPAAIYVIVAGFAGSIVASRRNILLRVFTPVAFSAMAFGYFFPTSSNRLIARASHSDVSKYLPQDLQKQVRDLTGRFDNNNNNNNNSSSHVAAAESTLGKTVQQVKNSAMEAGETVKEKVAEIKKVIVDEQKTKTKEADPETGATTTRAEEAHKRV